MIKTFDLVIVVGGTILVVLFFGPGMWSSDTEFFAVRLWKQWRARKNKQKGPPAGQDGATPPQD